MKRLCLVTPGNLTSTPRLVKAAGALAAAGYQVHVVAGRDFPPAEPLDAAILSAATWSCDRVSTRTGPFAFSRRIERLLARRWLRTRPNSIRLAARAHHAGHRALVAAAVRSRADFFYGHGGVAGLAIAADAARRCGVSYGFDAEDWHEEESDFVLHDPVERTAVRSLLAALLPNARLVTCAAPLIGEAFLGTYGVASVCLLNVFPLAEAPPVPIVPPPPSAEHPAVLYWFSQTVGPGRGLESLMELLGQLRTPVEVRLRGHVTAAYRNTLSAQAASAGFRGTLAFLPAAPAAEMVRLAARTHLGLSLEQSAPNNRNLCLTNKIFTYLLAGVPVALTPTRAQRLIAADLGPAALPLDRADPRTAAQRIDAWFRDGTAHARAAAWTLGHSRYNWDLEQHKLVAAVRAVMPLSS